MKISAMLSTETPRYAEPYPYASKNNAGSISQPKNFLNPSYMVKMMAELGADLKTVIPHPL